MIFSTAPFVGAVFSVLVLRQPLTPVLATAGLLMASGAQDPGISFFGMALAVFAVLFCWFMIKRAFDEDEELAGSRHPIREGL